MFNRPHVLKAEVYPKNSFNSNKQITADQNIIFLCILAFLAFSLAKTHCYYRAPNKSTWLLVHVYLSYVKSGKTQTAFMAWENITSKISQLIKYCIIVYVYVLWIKLQHVVHWWQKHADSKLLTDMKANCIVWFSSHICEWVSIVTLSLGIKFHNAFYQQWRLAM